ncbi:apoptosis-inducing factor 3-like isoform X2 [Pomacea canaliculata]|uniref:apoptosis-inducing factor 3-like isoform X2 n=1 Tax=Pomacea canaliculata TaxID=400727 RepID=UPI000D73CDCE|nr:apoptosis-inducing factor 3-like isoform X2 [Pomacea canaliculata]
MRCEGEQLFDLCEGKHGKHGSSASRLFASFITFRRIRNTSHVLMMLNPAKGIKEGVTRLCKTLVRSHITITGINTSFRVLSILIPSKLDSGGTSNNLKRSTLLRTPVAWRNETSALKQGYSWCQLRLLFSVTRTTRMGAKESKTRGGNVQGVNFAPREDTKPVYMSGCSTDTDSGNMASGVETVVCKVNDIGEGDAKEVQIGEHTALLVKENGNLYAVGNKCTHYGAPLSKGAYCNGVVRCPWHGACFNVKTGDIEDYPGLDSLPKFKVEVRSDEVVVTANPEDLKTSKRLKSMCRLDPRNKNTFVLVGGGAATATCAETLRQEGFTGRILVITKENNLPYDRPKLSKAMSSSAEAIALRKKEFYDEYGIEFTLGAEVTGVNTAKKKVTISDGSTISYNALLLATGGRPRTMTIPGQDLKNICVLRTPEDANYIAANSEGKNVVIIGSSFIGLEVAAFVHDKASSVSVVGTSRLPLQHIFGEQIGFIFKQMHEDKGVKFYFERGIKEFRGEDGHVTHAVLSDDTTLAADLCVLGIGVVPATDFLKDSSIKMTDRGFVTVDKYMKTNQSGVFAAGDIVEFPLFLNSNQQSNVQHWQMAHQHGRIAALNMLNKKVEIHSVPFFWTVMYGKSVRYTGYGHGYDDIVVHGDLSAPQFAAFYTKGDKVVAVASLAFDPIVSQAASLMEKGDTILKSEIQNDPKSWVGRLKQKL